MRTKKHNIRSGAVIVESLLVFPVILLLVIGIMQLAFSFSDSLHLKYTAYQASRISFLFESSDEFFENVEKGLLNKFLPRVELGNSSYNYEQDGLIYNVIDLGYRSRVIFPLNYKNSDGNLLFPPEGIRLRARGFYPMLKTKEE